MGDDVRQPIRAVSRATILLVAGWLPFFLALTQVIRLQPAFEDPTRSVEFLPGWTAYAGPASAYGMNWLLLLSLSGTGALLGWGLWIECVGARHLVVWPALRWFVLAGPLSAWTLLAVWGAMQDVRYRDDLWAVALFLHIPTLLVSYAIVGSGLRSVRSVGVWGMILLALWAVTAAVQLQFDRPGQIDPGDWIGFGGSMSLGLAVALRLAIWGWAEPPRGLARAS